MSCRWIIGVRCGRLMFSVFFFFVCVFLFQAEDGIRDLVRSRGLGDVYKRQRQHRFDLDRRPGDRLDRRRDRPPAAHGRGAARTGGRPVSYTHLTLPTSDLV